MITTAMVQNRNKGLFQLFAALILLFQTSDAWFFNRPTLRPPSIVKVDKEPILVVTDPKHQCNIHLIGVSHGSAASAELVDRTIRSINPSAVVLELCDERYLAMSLDARIEPKGNISLESLYQEKLLQLDAFRNNDNNPQLTNLLSNWKFIKSQGPLVGSFISMGFVATTMQSLFKSSTVDEFTTAMQIATENNIPIYLGDAPQRDTLQSMKQMVTKDTFDVDNFVDGAKSLGFSALGLWNKDVRHFQPLQNLDEAFQQVNWINIPTIYMENRQLLKALLPFALIMLSTSVFGMLPMSGQANADVQEIASIWDTTTSAVNQFAAVMVDVMATLVLVRMTKLIGSDRDKILASNIQEVCRKHKVCISLY